MLCPLLTPLLDATGIISSSSSRSGHLFVSRSVTSRRYFVSELSVPLGFKLSPVSSPDGVLLLLLLLRHAQVKLS